MMPFCKSAMARLLLSVLDSVPWFFFCLLPSFPLLSFCPLDPVPWLPTSTDPAGIYLGLMEVTDLNSLISGSWVAGAVGTAVGKRRKVLRPIKMSIFKKEKCQFGKE